MKPNEHMKLPDDELIAHIKEQLMAHEEDYAPGAWENFNSEKPAKKRGVFFWLGSVSSAAALILIGFAIFLVNDRKEGLRPSVLTANKPLNQAIKLPDAQSAKVLAPAELAKGKEKIKITEAAETVVAKTGRTIKPVRPLNKAALLAGFSNHTAPKQNAEVIASKDFSGQVTGINQDKGGDIVVVAKDKASEAASPVAPVVVKKQSLEEFLAQESKNGNARGRRNTGKPTGLDPQNDKWEMGVMVAPSFGSSKKLNMGYGVSMAYALSKKVSINSGISYNEMGASRNAASSGGGEQNMPSTFSGGFPSNSKQLQSVDASLQGIDIPLEISYRLSKSLYANVGISAFAVLNQKRKNIFLESQVQDSPVDPTGTFAFRANVLSTTITEERQSSDELKTDPYLGFYNFSLGYKQRISRGKSVSLEPFLKLPIKEFTQENLYLIGTGLRVKFDF